MAELPRMLCSSTDTYTVESVLGQGSYGIVAKCRRESDSRVVAIKMIEDHLIEAAAAEISVLEKLRGLDPDACNLVRWNQAFHDGSYTCLEFECLDKSLYDFMKETGFQPLPLKDIRPILKQAMSAVYHLNGLDIIHGDLKLENVMFENQREQPNKVKVIDFGLAHELSNARQGICIQSLPYRAPEIILECPYTTAVDVWSLGCIIAHLYLGQQYLYYGKTEYEMLKYIVETQGLPPDTLLDQGSLTDYYFTKDTCSDQSSWRLKTVEEFFKKNACQFKENKNRVLNSLDDILHLREISTADQQAYDDQIRDVHMFVDMLKGMLHLDPEQRLTPLQVLQHPFISTSHLSTDRPSSDASSRLKTMDVCGGVNRGAAQPVKQNRASVQGKRARMEQIRNQRKTCADQWTSCSSPSGSRFTSHHDEDLRLTLQRKRKSLDDDDLRLTLKRKRKSADDFTPEPARKRRHGLMQPPSSSECRTILHQRNMTEDTGSHDRKRSADQRVSCSSQSGSRVTLLQDDDLRWTLLRNRKLSDNLTPEPGRKRQRVITSDNKN